MDDWGRMALEKGKNEASPRKLSGCLGLSGPYRAGSPAGLSWCMRCPDASIPTLSTYPVNIKIGE